MSNLVRQMKKERDGKRDRETKNNSSVPTSNTRTHTNRIKNHTWKFPPSPWELSSVEFIFIRCPKSIRIYLFTWNGKAYPNIIWLVAVWPHNTKFVHKRRSSEASEWTDAIIIVLISNAMKLGLTSDTRLESFCLTDGVCRQYRTAIYRATAFHALPIKFSAKSNTKCVPFNFCSFITSLAS